MSGRVVVLGGGSTGEAFCAALRRLDADVPITLVESRLIGGECSYYACMPSKTLLRSPELVAQARHAPGVKGAELNPEGVFSWRNAVVDNWDDSSQEEWLGDQRVKIVRGAARVVAPGRIEADGRGLDYETLVVATGSVPSIPSVVGGVEHWTTADATSATEVPESLVVLGGGVAGCELAQLYRRLGSDVTVVQSRDRLLPRLDPDAGALLLHAFEEEGIDVRLGESAQSVAPGPRVTLSDGSTLEPQRLLVATGRRPSVDGLGLEQLGVEVGTGGIEVDEHLRAAERVYAIGDVTGVALLTHVGKYQARIAAVNVAGGTARADYRAIPAVSFTDPQIASVGSTEGVTASWPVEDVSRTATYERPKRPGFVKVVADPERRVLVGATAAGPEAGEWCQQLTLAIRAEVPIDVVRDTIQPYPTFSEAVFFAVRELPF